MIKIINVTCAIVYFDDKVLAVQRSNSMSLPLKWEFPGGKIEINETEEECIQREIFEELNIQIEITKRLKSVTHSYGNVTIKLIPFISKYKTGKITLKEHNNYKILSKDELDTLDWTEADLSILKELLIL